MKQTSLLSKINSPADLRRLNRADLPALAKEVREFVLQTVSQTGGHLGSNLGTVELTVALHYVFNTPHDRIVWDVGHQTYPHKILTGRREGMPTLRQLGGISGWSCPRLPIEMLKPLRTCPIRFSLPSFFRL